jgi:hypothetical protein
MANQAAKPGNQALRANSLQDIVVSGGGGRKSHPDNQELPVLTS